MSVIDLVGLVNMAGGTTGQGTTGCSFWVRSLQLYYTGKGSPPACCKDLACPRSLAEKVGGWALRDLYLCEHKAIIPIKLPSMSNKIWTKGSDLYSKH